MTGNHVGFKIPETDSRKTVKTYIWRAYKTEFEALMCVRRTKGLHVTSFREAIKSNNLFCTKWI